MYTNQSREKQWEKCPRSYLWRYVYNLDTKSGAKAFLGTEGHAALAAFYAGNAAYLDIYDAGCAAAPPEIAQSEDFLKLQPIWRERLKDYREFWARQDAQFEVVLVPEAELPLKVGDHTLMTKVDLIVKRRDNGSLWCMDHKFASRTGPSWWAQYYVDKQGTAYTLAAEQALQQEVVGWMINAIKPTKTEQFERQAFARLAAQKASFLRQTHWQLDRRAEFQPDHARVLAGGVDLSEGEIDIYYPQYTHECHGFGTCPFLAICQVGRAAIPTYAKRPADYVDQAA